MGSSSWEVMVDGLGRLEAPCIDPDENLCFSDIADEGAVYRLDPDGRLTTILSKRAHVGGLAAHADGGLVVGGSHISVITDERERIVMQPDGGWGFNDLTTDAAGNVFVGMHGEKPTIDPPTIEASLWRIAVGGDITHCYGGVQLTNGVRVSPDGMHLYHNDSLRRLVWVSDLSPEGLPQNRRVLHEFVAGFPDGMAVDEAGGVWIAMIGEGTLIRLTPAGEVDIVLEVSMPYVSALCFGGPDLRELFVTTFGAPYDPPHTGSVLCTRSPVPGLPLARARI